MQFRKISESMTDHEAEALLHILLPGSKMKEINRLEESNCVDIIFEFQEREWIITFFPGENQICFARMKSIIFQKN